MPHYYAQNYAGNPSFKPKVKTGLGNFSLVRRPCIEDFTIVINLVNRHVTWFNNALFVTFSDKSLAHFRFKHLQFLRKQQLR